MGDRIAIDGAYQHRALHEGNPVQRFWHHSKLQLIDTLLLPGPDDYVLDIGCGSGVCTNAIGSSGARALGIDGNSAAIAFAEQTYACDRVRFREAFVDELDGGGEFNKAICLEVVEHLYRNQIDALLSGARRCLSRGGRLLVTTPNYHSAWPLIEFSLDALKLVPTLKEEQHVTKFHHASLQACCESNGFRLLAARSICTLGPWIAPLSRRLAASSTALELKHRIPMGAILAHLYERA